MAAGKDYGIRNAGYYALRHLRIEKVIPYWGLDLDDKTTPLECGRRFKTTLDVSKLLFFAFEHNTFRQFIKTYKNVHE